MKKGFTLVELLAVIIIVGLIGIITVPMTMGAVEETRKSAFEAGAQNVLEAAVAYVTRVEQTGEIPEGGIKVEDLSEEIKNEKYISGVILKSEDGSIVLEGLSDGKFCASGTKNNLRIVKGKCSDLDNTPPTLKVMLNKRTSNSITIVADGYDATSGIYGYSYSTDGVNYGEITKNNIYTLTGLEKNETVKIYVRVYNSVYDGTENTENLSYSMTEKMVEYTTLNIEKPKFKISTTENSASTVKIVEIIYPENTERYEYSYVLNGKEEKVEGINARITILENGEIIARIKAENELIENKLVIAGIDNAGPVGNIVYNETWEQNKKIKIEVTYEQTGLPSEPYSYDGGLTWTSSNEKVYVSAEKLTGKIQVRDILGNITKKLTINGKEDEEIDYIDNVNPTCKLNVETGTEGNGGWYISDVKVGFEYKKDTLKHCENNECKEIEPGSGIKEFSIDKSNINENGTTTVTGTVKDNAGNVGTCSLEIKRDAKKPEAPTIKASDSKTSENWHSSDFTLSFSGSSSISGIIYQYSTNGTSYINGNSVSITTNTEETTYYVRACNGAGICSDVSTYVVKLDKSTPGVATITAWKSSAGTSIASGTWSNEWISYSISGSSAISGISYYQYCTDTTNTCTPNITVTGNSYVESSQYIRYRAVSNSGKVGTTSSYHALIDTENPTISVSVLGKTALFIIKDNIGVVGYGVNQSTTVQPSYIEFESTTDTRKSWTATAPGDYVVWVKDHIGRINKLSFTIKQSAFSYPAILTTYEATQFSHTHIGNSKQYGGCYTLERTGICEVRNLDSSQWYDEEQGCYAIFNFTEHTSCGIEEENHGYVECGGGGTFNVEVLYTHEYTYYDIGCGLEEGTNYTCPDGGELIGTVCEKYTCPDGGTLSGTTCVFE